MKTIFHIEDRGFQFIFHWVSYMLGGLRHIDTGNSIYGNLGGGVYEKNKDKYISGNLQKPYYIFFLKYDESVSYLKESLDLISDEFILIKEFDINDEDIVINNFGEPIYEIGTHLHPDSYVFLRNLFLKKISDNESKHKGKKYFIRRSKSHLSLGNVMENQIKRRQITNEDNLCETLESIGVESIFLEDYSFFEKILIFNQSDMIISPNSAALTFSIFSDLSTKIIEINVEAPHQISNQYESQCKCLNIPYFKLISEKIDSYDNMHVEPENLINLLQTLK
jgi:hypothetical protein